MQVLVSLIGRMDIHRHNMGVSRYLSIMCKYAAAAVGAAGDDKT